MTENSLLDRMISWLLPRLGELLFAAVFAAAIGLGPRMMNVDGDLGRHLTLGDYILDSRTIPTSDIFSFTKSAEPLTPHEWLSDVIFALAHRAAGLNGVVWITALVLAGSFWLVYRHNLLRSNLSLVALAGAVAAAAAGSVHWLTRPHIFTILFTALWTLELDRFRLGLRKTWLVFPLLMLVWVNLHGAFIAGFVIWAAFLAGMILDGQTVRRGFGGMVLIGPLSLLITLVNPDGIGIWKTAFGFLGNQYLVSHTAEYLPPDFQNPVFWPFLGVIIFSLLVLGLSRRRLSGSSLLLAAGWTAMALYSARNIPLYLVVVVPLLSDLTAGILAAHRGHPLVKGLLRYQGKVAAVEERIRGGVLAGIVPVLTLAMMLAGYQLDFQGAGNRFSPRVFPVQAAEWMVANPPPGDGFNYFPWGGYLLYRFWPERTVFIDGQTDFYGEALTREYERVITLAPGWEQVLEKYGVDWILIPTEARLADALEDHGDWELAYSDTTARLYIKVRGE